AENIEVLAIENNPLQIIPWNIYQLKKLRILSFRNTKINKLPDSISELKNLEYLDIRGTLISKEEIEILRALLYGVEIKSDYK
ncbi:MAG: leucine-rich repeat domain-containing protein, partial [Bacteroidia bacterium]|nr:leucine-rich repeat domain-containing protein [Bacteroidia bacterium]